MTVGLSVCKGGGLVEEGYPETGCLHGWNGGVSKASLPVTAFSFLALVAAGDPGIPGLQVPAPVFAFISIGLSPVCLCPCMAIF